MECRFQINYIFWDNFAMFDITPMICNIIVFMEYSSLEALYLNQT